MKKSVFIADFPLLFVFNNIIMYHCCFCSFEAAYLKNYMQLTRLHSYQASIPSGVNNCARTFRSLTALNSHVSLDHAKAKPSRYINVKINSLSVIEKCPIQICEAELYLADVVSNFK
jgi:hypothetical protein